MWAASVFKEAWLLVEERRLWLVLWRWWWWWWWWGRLQLCLLQLAERVGGGGSEEVKEGDGGVQTGETDKLSTAESERERERDDIIISIWFHKSFLMFYMLFVCLPFFSLCLWSGRSRATSLVAELSIKQSSQMLLSSGLSEWGGVALSVRGHWSMRPVRQTDKLKQQRANES